jgi:hypothetical protein
VRTPDDPPPAVPDIETRSYNRRLSVVSGEFETESHTVVLPEPVTKPYSIRPTPGRAEARWIASEIVRRGPRGVSDGDVDALARFLVAELGKIEDVGDDHDPGGRVIEVIDDDLDAIVIEVEDLAR